MTNFFGNPCQDSRASGLNIPRSTELSSNALKKDEMVNSNNVFGKWVLSSLLLALVGLPTTDVEAVVLDWASGSLAPSDVVAGEPIDVNDINRTGNIGSMLLANNSNELLDSIQGSDWEEASFIWEVEYDDAGTEAKDDDFWVYTYTFDANSDGKSNLSHLVIEVSDNFSLTNDVLSGTATYEELVTDPTSPTGEDGSEEGLFGLKFQADSNQYTAVIKSTRVPVFGDVFLKDGNVYAWNSGYLAVDPEGQVAQGTYDGYGWVATPDTTTITYVPEPASLAVWSVFGAAAAGAAARRRRRWSASKRQAIYSVIEGRSRN